MKYYSNSLSMIPLLLSLALTVSILSTSSAHKITYHNGPILTGEINLSILWYGNVKEQQKSQLRLFISSLNTDKNVTFEPRVIDWWRMVESYQLLADEKLKSAPKIKVNLVTEIDDRTQTNLRDGDFKDAVKKVAGDGKTIAVIILGEKVEWESARSRCFMHNFDGEQLAIVVVNQMGKAKNNCGWPFLAPPQGNVGFLVPAPTEEYADLMVIHFASALAGTVTNPQGTGFFSDDKEDNEDDDKEEEKDSLIDVASLCEGIFGTGAFPGYAGRVRIDPRSGAGFNAHGLNSTKFMLPAIVNPKDGSCWTTL